MKKVSYKVEDARVGQITDYDKLVMNIETDSSIEKNLQLKLKEISFVQKDKKMLKSTLWIYLQTAKRELTKIIGKLRMAKRIMQKTSSWN